MADTNDKRSVASWWDGIKAEFGKIVWPTRETIYKQTVATAVISIIVSLIIVFIDMLIQNGVDVLVGI